MMNIKSVKLNENLKAHMFFPNFNDDVAIINEIKTCYGWVVDPPFSIPRQLLVFIIAIENLPEISVPYNCRLLQKPHRKHKFASVRQHGTE